MLLLRFVFNFILFGILFFLIWHFFPDAFNTLVSWAGSIVDFFTNLFSGLFQKATEHSKEVKEEIKAAVIFFLS